MGRPAGRPRDGEPLLKNYGTDPQTTSFVDNLDIFIDPSVNPDGGNYSMLQGGGSGQRHTMTHYCGPNNEAGAGGDVASTSFDPASRGTGASTTTAASPSARCSTATRARRRAARATSTPAPAS